MAYATDGWEEEPVKRVRVVSALTVISLLVVSGFSGTAGAEEAGASLPVLAAAAATPDYRPLDPARLADTRPARPTVDGNFQGRGLVTPGSPLVLTVGGRGGVPSTGVAAVALNVTVTGTVDPGYLTVFPTGEARPTASNVNYDRRVTVANSVIAKLGSANQVTIYSSVPAHVLVDVSGYFVTGGITALTPARLADTRPTGTSTDGQFVRSGTLSPTKPLQLQVTGRGGVPATNVKAVALNVVAVTPAGEGYLTVFPAGTARPVASNVNFRTGETVSNSVVVKVGTGGKVTIYNSNRACSRRCGRGRIFHHQLHVRGAQSRAVR